MRLSSTLFVLLPLMIAMPALCQDLLKAAPGAAKVEYEDARVRVVRLKLAPHEQLPMHDRPARVVITLTENDVVLPGADGAGSSNTRAPAGKIAWSGPGKRSVRNGATALENVVVELKQADAPAQALSHPPEPRPATYLDEPFHHWIFENQYFRVYEVRIPPGATTNYHLHALDTVVVEISGGKTAAQPQGGDWGQPHDSNSGSVDWLADAGKPRVHRVRNHGNKEFHVVLVQLLH